MKKAIVTIAIVLGLGATAIAGPNGGGLFQRGLVSDEEYYGMGYRGDTPCFPTTARLTTPTPTKPPSAAASPC